jgi:NADH-ubiquinone oxidoreductase chain 5
MSQLGMMVIAIGLSSYNIALFHLINHAFYKALLFLGAGSVIHAVSDNQDFRKFGGLIKFLPLTYSVMLIASLSLVAFPFMTGFYSKDFILESAYGQFTFSGISVYIIATVGAIFTTLYSVKVLYLTFLANPNGPKIYYKFAHEGNIFLTMPLIFLAVFSIFFGFIVKDIFIGLGSNFFVDNSLFIHPIHEIMIDTEFAVSTLFKLLPFIFTVSFSFIALGISELFPGLIINFKLSRLGYNIFGFFNQRFLVEFFYNNYITNLILNLGGQTTKILDKGSLELCGPYGLEKGLINLSKNFGYLNTGFVTNYALFILIGFILYLLGIFSYLNLIFNLSLFILLISFGLVSMLIYKTYNKIKISKNVRFSFKKPILVAGAGLPLGGISNSGNMMSEKDKLIIHITKHSSNNSSISSSNSSSIIEQVNDKLNLSNNNLLDSNNHGDIVNITGKTLYKACNNIYSYISDLLSFLSPFSFTKSNVNYMPSPSKIFPDIMSIPSDRLGICPPKGKTCNSSFNLEEVSHDYLHDLNISTFLGEFILTYDRPLIMLMSFLLFSFMLNFIKEGFSCLNIFFLYLKKYIYYIFN